MKYDEMNIEIKLNADGDIDLDYYEREARKAQAEVLANLVTSAASKVKSGLSYVYHRAFHLNGPAPQH